MKTTGTIWIKLQVAREQNHKNTQLKADSDLCYNLLKKSWKKVTQISLMEKKVLWDYS